MHAEQHHCRCQRASTHSLADQNREIQLHDPPASKEGNIQWETAGRTGEFLHIRGSKDGSVVNLCMFPE